jgi:PAS domain S-box-containing protein
MTDETTAELQGACFRIYSINYEETIVNYIAYISLISSIICLGLAFFVYYSNTKSKENIIFSIFLILLSIWTFAEFMYIRAPSADVAARWIQLVSLIWTYVIAILFHFVLIYTQQKRILRKKITYVLIYLPAVIFSAIDVFTKLITGPPVKEFWGYTNSMPATIVNYLVSSWAFILGIGVLIIVIWSYFHANDMRSKLRNKYMLMGLFFPVTLGLLTETILPLVFDTRIPDFLSISMVICCMIIAYATWKYKIFMLTIEAAAKSILSSIPDSIILIDLEGNIVTVNDVVRDVTGYRKEDLENKVVSILFAADMNFHKLMFFMKTHNNTDIAAQFKIADGTTIPVSVSISEILDKRLILRGYVLVCRDISNRKQAEEDLQRLNSSLMEKDSEISSINSELEKVNKQLKDLDAKKDEFISLAAHELKTPLTSIRGFAQILQEQNLILDRNKSMHYLNLIESNTDTLYQLVTDIVDSSRLSLGKLTLNIEEVDVNSIYQEISENLIMLIKNKNLTPDFNIDNNLPKIRADAARTMQVLRNFISNSIKFTSSGSIKLKIYRLGNYVCFEVSDTGQGIPDENKPMIFSKFYQVDSSMTRKTGGSGLGLSICKGLVEGMNGKIWFDSMVGIGSTFYFTLPIVQSNDSHQQ